MKKGRSAYVFYTMENLERIRKEHPDWPQPQLIKYIANEWQKLTQEQREPYHQKASEDKLRKQQGVERGRENGGG